jgi:hypothetical protein
VSTDPAIARDAAGGCIVGSGRPLFAAQEIP